MGPALIVPIVFALATTGAVITIKLIAQMIARNYESGKIDRSPIWNYQNDGHYLDLTLYHGTDQESADLIKNSNYFRPSTQGNLGKGVYFTDDKQKAKAIGNRRAQQRCVSKGAIIQCRVKGYERYLRVGQHEKWINVCDKFTQFCLKPGHGSIEIKSVDKFNRY